MKEYEISYFNITVRAESEEEAYGIAKCETIRGAATIDEIVSVRDIDEEEKEKGVNNNE